MLSTSLGFSVLKRFAVVCKREASPVLMGTPSTTHSGAVDAVIELTPRIRIAWLDPGCPDEAVDCTPATCPCNALSMEVKGLFSISAAFTVATEPVRSVRFLVPYATTTTSVIAPAFVDSVTGYSLLAVRLISFSPRPTEEKIRAFAVEGTEMEKVPSEAVLVPVFVPFTKTEAPGIGAPLSSVTFPVIVRCCCAQIWPMEREIAISSSTTFLMCDLVFCYKKCLIKSASQGICYILRVGVYLNRI